MRKILAAILFEPGAAEVLTLPLCYAFSLLRGHGCIFETLKNAHVLLHLVGRVQLRVLVRQFPTKFPVFVALALGHRLVVILIKQNFKAKMNVLVAPRMKSSLKKF